MQMWQISMKESDPGQGHVQRYGIHWICTTLSAWEAYALPIGTKQEEIKQKKKRKGKEKTKLFLMALSKNLREEQKIDLKKNK